MEEKITMGTKTDFITNVHEYIRATAEELTNLDLTDTDNSNILRERIGELTVLANEYQITKKHLDDLESKFDSLRKSNFGCVYLPLTEGSINQSYINCNPALAANLAPKDGRIININLPIDSKKTGTKNLQTKVLSNGYLQDRTILKDLIEFYKLHPGDELKWTKLGPSSFSLSMTEDYEEELYGAPLGNEEFS